MGAAQVFVVGNAETMVSQEASPEAANALLKLLEEPPTGTHVILTSSEPGRLLATIRSRTVPVHVGRLPAETVTRFLVEQAGVDPSAAQGVTRLADGSIGRALGLLPDEEGARPLEDLRQQALALVRAALSPRQGDAYAVALDFGPTKARLLLELLDFLDQAFRDVAAVAAGAPERAANPEIAALMGAKGALAPHPTDAARCLAIFERCRELARGNVNPQLLVAGLIGELRRTLTGRRPSPAWLSA
jgi:DNA polymerase-3 subunit delta'